MNDLLYNLNKAVKKRVFINGNFDFTKIKNIKQIGCGAFGYIYKISDNDKPICIKITKDVSNKKLSDILSDSKIKNQLKNFIPNVYETGQALIGKVNYYYTIMDFVDGDEIDNYEFNNHQVIELFIFLIKFMYILHKNNLAYTDIKPKNIMYDGNYFKIVDIDTIKHQWIYQNKEKEITTEKYYFTIDHPFRKTIHPLQQLSACVLTCLEIIKMYPNCKQNNYNTKKKSYINAMIDFVEKNNIKSPIELENKDTFYKLLIQLNKKTNNLAYSLLFLINIYIELIPKFTIAYIDVNYVVNVLTYYMNSINHDFTIGNELCNNINKEHIFIGKTNVHYSLLDNIEELINMIPFTINEDYYIKKIYPHYKEFIDIKKNQFSIKRHPEKIKNIIIDDKYKYYRKDPRVLEHLDKFN